jgi:hypothetical protein
VGIWIDDAKEEKYLGVFVGHASPAHEAKRAAARA